MNAQMFSPTRTTGRRLDAGARGLAVAFFLVSLTVSFGRTGLSQRATEADTDGDGVADSRDRCPRSPRAAPMVTPGCSALDLAESADRMIAPLAVELADAANRAALRPELTAARSAVEAALSIVDTAIESLGAGRVCQGRSEMTDAVRKIESAEAATRQAIETGRSDLRRKRAPAGSADFDEPEADLLFLEVRLQDFEQSRDRFSEAISYLSDTCGRIAGSAVGGGTIAGIDDRLRRVELANGQVVGLAANFGSPQPSLTVGQTVEFFGTKFEDGSGLATSAKVLDVSPPFSGIDLNLVCVKLRFAPVQPRHPTYKGPWTKHRPDGYFYGATYWIENGMGVGIDLVDCPQAGTPPVSYQRYSSEATLTYKRAGDNAVVTETIAYDLTADGPPVFLNQKVASLSTATLTLKPRVQSCTLTLGCSAPKPLAATTYALSIVPLHGRCLAGYNKVEFSLEDKDFTSFRPASVAQTMVLAAADSGESITFSAQAYKVTGGSTTYPDAAAIGTNQAFGVYNHDFFSPETLYAEELLGVSKASGLMWPKVTGIRNGHVFSYSCQLPDLVRDVIYFGSPLNTYYRLPFSGGTFSNPMWIMGQGNDTTFTHKGDAKYAFDFKAAAGTTVKAARGGTVLLVKENQTGNSFNSSACSNCDANAVVIRHQDGTEAAYLHMPFNGVLVEKWSQVRRGDSIAKVGSTGYSSEPHLHFQAQNSLKVTHPSCFEAIAPWPQGFNQLLKCFIPAPGDLLQSTQ